MMASQRKMLDLSEEAWNAVMDTALKYRPALVLIPGDLTMDSEKASHDVVVNSLNKLHAEGIRTIVIPGNHDIGGNAYAYKGEQKIQVENLKDELWESQYAWVYEQAAAKDPHSHSFASEPLEGLTVLGIDGSHNAEGTGSLSDETLAWILAQADVAKKKNHMIIGMCHWQLMDHFDKQSSLESSCQLKDAAAIRDSLMRHGVHTVLTGHFHVNGITTWKDGNDSIVEITTGSPITYPCPYRWLTIDEDRKSLSVETEDITALPSHPDLQTYSRAWMAEHTHSMINVLAPRIWNRMDDIQAKLEQQFGATTVQLLMQVLPQTNEERIALVDKHIGSTVVELYLLHSDANEPDHREADSLAQAFYTGMNNMIKEVLSVSIALKMVLLEPMTAYANSLAKEPLQSLVEDKTQWSSTNPDRTDDLHLTLAVADGYVRETLGIISVEVNTQKIVRNGQMLIIRNGKIYTIQGQELK